MNTTSIIAALVCLCSSANKAMFSVLMSECVKSVNGQVDRCVQTEGASLYSLHCILSFRSTFLELELMQGFTNDPQWVLQCDEVSGAGLVGPNRKVLEPQMDNLQSEHCRGVLISFISILRAKKRERLTTASAHLCAAVPV